MSAPRAIMPRSVMNLLKKNRKYVNVLHAKRKSLEGLLLLPQ